MNVTTSGLDAIFPLRHARRAGVALIAATPRNIKKNERMPLWHDVIVFGRQQNAIAARERQEAFEAAMQRFYSTAEKAIRDGRADGETIVKIARRVLDVDGES